MITVEHLTKRFRGVTAVDDVSFTCAPGTVTGFLGPNGAGKSTTLRMVCGLTRPTSGSATVAGVPYRQLANPGRQVGLLLDASVGHPGRSGRETLSLAARVLGVDRARVDRVLDLVGLAPAAARRRVGGYSLGMRQRLGVAQALLGEPRVLILDEPVNGLDPEGMAAMRLLLREFADGGGTVLLSSHLLREVEAVADRYLVIARGRIVAQGDRGDVLGRPGGTLVRAVDTDHLRAALAAAGLAARAEHDALVVPADTETVGRVVAAAGAVLIELRPAGDSGGLEELFLSLVAESVGAAGPGGHGAPAAPGRSSAHPRVGALR